MDGTTRGTYEMKHIVYGIGESRPRKPIVGGAFRRWGWNAIFRDLATVGSSGANAKTIDVRNTVGASGCDTSIATSKGWQVTTS